jgi:hypothetical protein
LGGKLQDGEQNSLFWAVQTSFRYQQCVLPGKGRNGTKKSRILLTFTTVYLLLYQANVLLAAILITTRVLSVLMMHVYVLKVV